MNQKKVSRISYRDLRIIAISLSVLSLGLAIAYAGLLWYSKGKSAPKTPPSSISTPSSTLK